MKFRKISISLSQLCDVYVKVQTFTHVKFDISAASHFPVALDWIDSFHGGKVDRVDGRISDRLP